MEKKLEAALNSSSIQPPVGTLRRTTGRRMLAMLKGPEGGSGSSSSSSSGGGSGSGSGDDDNNEHDANKIRSKARRQSALQRFAKAMAAPLRKLSSIQLRRRSVAAGADDMDAKNVADDENTSEGGRKKRAKKQKKKEKDQEKEGSNSMRMSGVKMPDESAQPSPHKLKRSVLSTKRQGSTVGSLADALKDSAIKISDSFTSTPESYKQKISFNKSKMKDQLIFADGTIKVVPRSSFSDDLDSTGGGGRSRSSTADGNLTPFGRSRKHGSSFNTAQDLHQRYSTRPMDSEVDPTATCSRQDSLDSDIYQGRCRNTSLDSADFMPRSRNASMDSVLSSEDDKPSGGGGISVDLGSMSPTGRIRSRSGSVTAPKSRSGSYEIAPEQMISFREESISALKYIHLSRQSAGDISPLLSGWDESDCSSVDDVLRSSQTSRKRRNSTLEIIGEDDGNDRSMKDDGDDNLEKDMSSLRTGRW